jgi:two-component system alkaline phosphatase synthesis response regulator PhoP
MLTADSSPYRILVVDDEPHIVQILKFTLEKEGYQVFTAENGQLALELVQSVQPHLVILDIMMPVMDGYETCRCSPPRAIPLRGLKGSRGAPTTF